MKIKTTQNGNVKITLTREQLESLHNLLTNTPYWSWKRVTNEETADLACELWSKMGEYIEDN